MKKPNTNRKSKETFIQADNTGKDVKLKFNEVVDNPKAVPSKLTSLPANLNFFS